MYKSISCVITLYAIQVSKVVKMMKMFSHINSGIVLDSVAILPFARNHNDRVKLEK